MMMMEKQKSELVNVSRLVPWGRNPRKNDAAAKRLAESIQANGWGAPLLVQAGSMRVIAGHTRLKAAVILGIDAVPCVLLDVSDAQADRLAISDNKLGELAAWDDELLAGLLADIGNDDALLLGFSSDELDALLQPLPDLSLDGLSDVPSINGESELGRFAFVVSKDDVDEVADAIKHEWGDPLAPSGKAERLGALFLHLWRSRG